MTVIVDKNSTTSSRLAALARDPTGGLAREVLAISVFPRSLGKVSQQPMEPSLHWPQFAGLPLGSDQILLVGGLTLQFS